jgi:hypothetical protein
MMPLPWGLFFIPVPVPTYDAVWNALQSFLVSPGFGGLAAVVAALIAVSGVKRQIRSSATEKKEERWWETLKWVYGEATKAAIQADPLPKVVAVQVLNELRSTADSDSALQRETVDSLVAHFDQTKQLTLKTDQDANDQSSISQVDVGNQLLESALTEYWAGATPLQVAEVASHYERALISTIKDLARKCDLQVETALMDLGFEAVLVANGVGCAVVAKIRRSGSLERKAIEYTKRLLGTTFHDENGKQVTIARVLIVTNAQRWIHAPSTSSQVDVVTWLGAADSDKLRRSMECFVRESQPQ